MPTVSIATKRLSKTVNGKVTQFYYNGNVLSAQKSGNEVIYFMYDNNADIFGFIYNGTEYFYVKNAQNDVVAITDSTGKVIANYYYDDWGKLIETTGNTAIANLNPIRYRSYYYDSETGWYYLNTRYYAPEMSRFLNADTVNVLEAKGDLYDLPTATIILSCEWTLVGSFGIPFLM